LSAALAQKTVLRTLSLLTPVWDAPKPSLWVGLPEESRAATAQAAKGVAEAINDTHLEMQFVLFLKVICLPDAGMESTVFHQMPAWNLLYFIRCRHGG
jgi:hypothetical protein